MKISSFDQNRKNMAVNTEKLDKINSDKVDFANTLKAVKENNYTNLEKLLQEVDLRAQRLAESCTLSELREYKKAIKRFLHETIGKSYEAEERNGFNRSGRHKIYVLVKKVNDNLEKLSLQVLEEQKDQIKILKKIDEIRGLLVDLYL